MPPTSARAGVCVSVLGLCVTEWGNPPLSHYGDVNGDIQGKGGGCVCWWVVGGTGGLSQEGRGVPL